MTMLLLRRVHADLPDQPPLHVVGENSLDATAVLALGPTSKRCMVPDFVNTQAIYARALAQALAYPVMAPAISQLFMVEKDSPQLVLHPAGTEFLPEGRWSFAQVCLVF